MAGGLTSHCRLRYPMGRFSLCFCHLFLFLEKSWRASSSEEALCLSRLPSLRFSVKKRKREQERRENRDIREVIQHRVLFFFAMHGCGVLWFPADRISEDPCFMMKGVS